MTELVQDVLGFMDGYEDCYQTRKRKRNAGALVAGDAIRDKDLRELIMLAVEIDTKPQMVHNLEIADAHTYFAGELEAWGHNGKIAKLFAIGCLHILSGFTEAKPGTANEVKWVGAGELDPDTAPEKPRKPKRRRTKSCPHYLPSGRITKFLMRSK